MVFSRDLLKGTIFASVDEMTDGHLSRGPSDIGRLAVGQGSTDGTVGALTTGGHGLDTQVTTLCLDGGPRDGILGF